ncbi:MULTISPECIES: DUF3311 domain-containing protein [Pandoraea]|uniref:DUF3311 domain-containing protein n=3 Tax=Pandoraea TaxID=93217 RepID=A0A5E4XQF6_9BURK|nr:MULTISPECIES: DUF3311 domain-containing protein [Pandoraea]MCE4062606.1 DUF3311 domain-containing protein [Pandoraea sputorum]UVA80921.1 DUF3311 domain-containing protein [Pandoraea commovens]VVE37127.1 permease [Pandoraea aquatica]VVE38629.1 permease [Pandoraea commovens]VVE66947.1 permease [Pandoraea anapnoica]
MRSIHLLALLPVLAVLVGPFFVNRVTPYVLGMPFLLAWLAGALVLTSIVMAIIYYADRARFEAADHGQEGV